MRKHLAVISLSALLSAATSAHAQNEVDELTSAILNLRELIAIEESESLNDVSLILAEGNAARDLALSEGIALDCQDEPINVNHIRAAGERARERYEALLPEPATLTDGSFRNIVREGIRMGCGSELPSGSGVLALQRALQSIEFIEALRRELHLRSERLRELVSGG